MKTAETVIPADNKRAWTKNRVANLIGDALCMLVVGVASLTCVLPFIHIR